MDDLRGAGAGRASVGAPSPTPEVFCMYDAWREPNPFPPYDPTPDLATGLADRVTHLVFVGGRLVDSWTEDAADTRWRDLVERPVQPPPPPDPPLHARVLDWLADVCGGPAAVAALHADPLPERPDGPVPEVPDRAAEELLSATADLTDLVADRWFDEETSYAFRAALRALVLDDPLTVQRSRTAAHLAGGICWAVGKANGLFQPVGHRRVGTLQDTLALTGTASGKGNEVAAALRGFRGHRADRWGRPSGVPDLLALGRPELLVSSTRAQLVRIRERAEAAAAA